MCPKYGEVHHRNADQDIEVFFTKSEYNKFQMENFQEFNLKGLLGRLFSSSYTPREHDSNYQVLKTEMQKLFNKFQINNKVKFEYYTILYYGRI